MPQPAPPESPRYQQIYRQLREQILAGHYPAGTRLPPTRKLAQQLGVARITVSQAYAQLQLEGYLVTRPGAGTYVSPLLAATPAPDQPVQPALSGWGQRVVAHTHEPERPAGPPPSAGLIDFGFGRSFPHIFPYDVWRHLLARYLSTDDVMLSRYGSVAGFMPLRAAVAEYLARLRGVHCTAEQVIIVNGAQQALDILARLLLDPGDRVLVETPGYTDAYALFAVHGALLQPYPVDEHGFPVETIPAGATARLLFVTPANQFPRGGTLPLARRLALLRWAEAANALIIEDDYDGELRYEGRPVGALQGLDKTGRVIYLGTFSKVLFPALRLGYVVLPPALVAPFIRAKQVIDRGAPTLTQAAVADFITEGHFERHLRHLRHAYGQRRQQLVCALQERLPAGARFSPEPAGLHIMLYLPPGRDEAEVIRRAVEAGVRVYPGAAYHLEQPAPPAILLGFSGLSETEIEEGLRRLAVAVGDGVIG